METYGFRTPDPNIRVRLYYLESAADVRRFGEVFGFPVTEGDFTSVTIPSSPACVAAAGYTVVEEVHVEETSKEGDPYRHADGGVSTFIAEMTNTFSRGRARQPQGGYTPDTGWASHPLRLALLERPADAPEGSGGESR